MQYIPAPNASVDQFATSSYNQALRDDKGAIRLDANTGWGLISGYYFLDDYSLDNPYPVAQGGASVPGFDALYLGRAQLFSLGDTKTLNATAVNELHFSYMRAFNDLGKPQADSASASYLRASSRPREPQPLWRSTPRAKE